MKKRIIALVLAAVMAAAFLTACGKTAEKTTDSGYAKEIYLYNWSEYMLPEVLDAFEAEYGIKVIETTFESNDEMLAKLLAGNNGEFDIAVPSNFFIEAMLANDLLEELDFSVLTNYENLDDAYKNMAYDPEGKYTVPYMGTVACWVGNTAKLAELGVEVNNYDDLKNPALAGNVLFSDDSQGNICCGLSAMDLDPTSTDLNDIQAAKEYLLSINSNVKAYSLPADVRDAMIKGEAAAAYMYSGNAMQAMLENDDLAIIMNEEQVSLSVDTMVVLKGTQHKTEAQLFLNFLLRPEISAQLTREFPYVNFNKAAYSQLDKDLAESPLCVLTPDMQSRIYMLTTFDGEAISAEVDAMTEVKAAR
ncbi:MAG: spermidine/putrescine ABC transporter substrate-binding protein [Oscillospiraceae bacterium]|nr:spermidine/putrescine ABC transporter substrate-binding protein [Oscillospiraceae bacterium]